MSCKAIRVKAYKSLHITSVSGCEKVKATGPILDVSWVEAVLNEKMPKCEQHREKKRNEIE
jgi:hypothetical protein